MPDWLARLGEEAKAVASAPILSATALFASVAVIWFIFQWSYGALLTNKDTHIAFLERRVADYRDKLGGATPDEARARIDGLETEVRTLRIRLQPRRLTAVQKQAIIDQSRLPSGAQPRLLAVVYEEKCSDCTSYAEELAAALHASGGWTLTTRVAASIGERPRHGLAVRVAEPLRPPPSAAALQGALRSANLAFDTISGGFGETAELLITERIPQ